MTPPETGRSSGESRTIAGLTMSELHRKVPSLSHLRAVVSTCIPSGPQSRIPEYTELETSPALCCLLPLRHHWLLTTPRAITKVFADPIHFPGAFQNHIHRLPNEPPTTNHQRTPGRPCRDDQPTTPPTCQNQPTSKTKATAASKPATMSWPKRSTRKRKSPHPTSPLPQPN